MEDSMTESRPSFFKRIFPRYSDIAFHPMDIVFLGYLAILGLLIIFFHNEVPMWPLFPVAHVALIFLILEFLKFFNDKPSKVLHFVRTFYPAIILAILWMELNSLVTMIFPYWANDFVVNLDKAIFGVHPTVWVETIFTPWLTELMNFFYAFYYLFIPMTAFNLYFRGRKQETFDYLFLVFLAYTTVFLIFLLFPAEGPWVILKGMHTVKPEGGLFLKLNEMIQGQGSIRGGCFPSSHVAAAFAIVWGTLKYQRKLGIFLFPCVIGMSIATVYCQYHHAVDALAGALLGTITTIIGFAILKKWHGQGNGTTTQK